MTDVQLEQATERLQRKLNLTDPDGDTLALLGDELLDAEGELLLYLGWEALDETLMGKAVELAACTTSRTGWWSGATAAGTTVRAR